MKVKKVIALLLAVSMVLSMTFSSFAESDITKVDETATKIEADTESETNNGNETYNMIADDSKKRIKRLEGDNKDAIIGEKNANDSKADSEESIEKEQDDINNPMYNENKRTIATLSEIKEKFLGTGDSNFKYIIRYDWNVPNGSNISNANFEFTYPGTNDQTAFYNSTWETNDYYFVEWKADKQILYLDQDFKDRIDRYIELTNEDVKTIERHQIKQQLNNKKYIQGLSEKKEIPDGPNYPPFDFFGLYMGNENPYLPMEDRYEHYFNVVEEILGVTKENTELIKWFNKYYDASTNSITINLKGVWKRKNLRELTINIDPNLPDGTIIDDENWHSTEIDQNTRSITSYFDVDNNTIDWTYHFPTDNNHMMDISDFLHAWSDFRIKFENGDESPYRWAGYDYDQKSPISNIWDDPYYEDYVGASNKLLLSKFSNNSITLYAVWNKNVHFNYMIVFKDDNKYLYPSQFLNIGDKVATPSSPTKVNKTFEGWYYKNAENVEVKWDFNHELADDEGSTEITLYTKWKNNPSPSNGYNPSYGGPSGGSGGNGGGGGGGIISTQGAGGSGPNSAPATRKVAAKKMTVKGVMKTESVSWAYDPTSNKWKLNLKDVAGSAVPLADGFFSISNTANQNVTDTYYFDEAGNMVTGWIQTGDNKWYFFENAMTADEGKMQHGWKQVGGAWYYFGQDGAMLQGSTTPDGYNVDADGKWVSNTTTA